MIDRTEYFKRLGVAVARSPITVLLGARQVGKTTLARQFGTERGCTFFDLESEQDFSALANAELALGSLPGIVVIDEVQLMPALFKALRVLADRTDIDTRFLILGSASPELVKGASETLAGRVEFIDMAGFHLGEIGCENLRQLWLRGGFPRSYLASFDEDSLVWREGFIRTFLERDMPRLGIRIPSRAIRRFWTMLAHWHGQTWNASELGRSMDATNKTVRHYLDLLTGTFMVRQVQPWFSNLGKRQVKAPKVYFQDSGLLHSLLGIDSERDLISHPKVGASWEGFVIEQILRALGQPQAWFWAAHAGGEIDLLIQRGGRLYGFEAKYSEAPKIGKLLRKSAKLLELDHLFVVCPTRRTYQADEDITVLAAADIPNLGERFRAAG